VTNFFMMGPRCWRWSCW